eukprot:3059886-Pyramimonas_sp.AAC.1
MYSELCWARSTSQSFVLRRARCSTDLGQTAVRSTLRPSLVSNVQTPGPSFQPMRLQLAGAAEIGPRARAHSVFTPAGQARVASEANKTRAIHPRGSHGPQTT